MIEEHERHTKLLERIMIEERDRRMSGIAPTREAFIRSISSQGSMKIKYAGILNAAVAERAKTEMFSANPPFQNFLGDASHAAAIARINMPTPKDWVQAELRQWAESRVLEILRGDYGHWQDDGTINNPGSSFVEDYWFEEGKVTDSPALKEVVAGLVDQICRDAFK